MTTDQRASLEEVLRLARQIAEQLEPIAARSTDTDGLCARLAQAHALGLIDQLSEIVGDRASNVPTARYAAAHSDVTAEQEDGSVRAQ